MRIMRRENAEIGLGYGLIYGASLQYSHMETERRRLADKLCKEKACKIQSCLQGEEGEGRVRML